MTEINSIVLLGSGNVAHHLGHHLQANGLHIKQVWSRSVAHAEALATQLGCAGTNQLTAIAKDADLYILAVSDDALGSLARSLAQQLPNSALVVHTSGATPSTILAEVFEHYGVFYPLQTFSKSRQLDFTEVPLCIFASHQADQIQLQALAKRLVRHSYLVNDVQRSQLHLAAVFVNNFTNYLQHVAQSITAQHQLPWTILQPLLEETVAKLQQLPAQEAQTGPAIRGDQLTQERHLTQLADYEDWAAVYQLLSQRIEDELGDNQH